MAASSASSASSSSSSASSGSRNGEGDTDGVSWRLIGAASELANKRCRLMYSSLGYNSDVCLFYVKGEFFAMDARCAHSGGPLCEGDIEEADGVLQVICPWHDYDFDLRTGKSGTSLQQQVYEVKLEDGNVYVKHASRLSLLPFPAEKKS
ncbi:Rieske domain-containing protein [Solea solea]|uniref:Rieske domain-containing protein n=1 Tax=Solea solea TaxID=90069 RepID=UPI00272AB319|nr:Rieske domain-containing protein [Solea solea]